MAADPNFKLLARHYDGGGFARNAKHINFGAKGDGIQDDTNALQDLLDAVSDGDLEAAVGRAAHQGPEVDGVVLLPGVDAPIGSWVRALVVDSDGVDLIARPESAHAE